MLKNSISAVILAGGRGKRLGAGVPKGFAKMNNLPLLSYSISLFVGFSRISEIIVVVPIKYIKKTNIICSKMFPQKEIKVIAGGKERMHSSSNGILATSETSKYIIIHDAARPFTSKQLVKNLIATAPYYDGVIPGVEPIDTIKIVNDRKIVQSTTTRKNTFHIQTPQIFKRDKLIKGLNCIKTQRTQAFAITDDSMLIELIDGKIKVIKGSSSNKKVTIKEDMRQ